MDYKMLYAIFMVVGRVGDSSDRINFLNDMN